MPNLKQRFSCEKIAGSPERAANTNNRIGFTLKNKPAENFTFVLLIIVLFVILF